MMTTKKLYADRRLPGNGQQAENNGKSNLFRLIRGKVGAQEVTNAVPTAAMHARILPAAYLARSGKTDAWQSLQVANRGKTPAPSNQGPTPIPPGVVSYMATNKQSASRSSLPLDLVRINSERVYQEVDAMRTIILEGILQPNQEGNQQVKQEVDILAGRFQQQFLDTSELNKTKVDEIAIAFLKMLNFIEVTTKQHEKLDQEMAKDFYQGGNI